MTKEKVVAEFQDRFGETRVVHKNKNGLAVKRERSTVILQLNKVVASMIGARIRKVREQRGYSLAQLCLKAGIVSGTPKSRMWEIENGVRQDGIRLGTLYALALALEVEPSELLPTRAEVLEIAPVGVVSETSLTPINGALSKSA